MSFSFGAGTGSTTGGGFNFGGATTGGGFSFGAPAAATTSTTTTTTAPTTTPSFSFGATTTPAATTTSTSTPATTSSFSFGAAPATSTTTPAATTGFSFGTTTTPATTSTTSTTAAPSFGFGGFGASSAAATTTAATAASSSATSSSFSFGSTPAATTSTTTTTAAPTTSATSSFSFGSTTAAPSTSSATTTTTTGTTGFSLGGTTTSSTSTTSAASVPGVTSKSSDQKNTEVSSTRLKHGTVEDIIGLWNRELEDHASAFVDQALLIAKWDELMLENLKKIIHLQNQVTSVQKQQTQLNGLLDTIRTNQEEFNTVLDELEEKVNQLPKRSGNDDLKREEAYELAEVIDNSLLNMSETLSKSIQSLNNNTERHLDPNNPLTAVLKILNHHMTSLQWIEHSSEQLALKINVAQREVGATQTNTQNLQNGFHNNYQNGYSDQRKF